MEAYQTKVKDLCDLKREIEILKAEGERIVFTNGCFDILHKGHITYLSQAADLGKILIIGLKVGGECFSRRFEQLFELAVSGEGIFEASVYNGGIV